jgi:hypothetical protein
MISYNKRIAHYYDCQFPSSSNAWISKLTVFQIEFVSKATQTFRRRTILTKAKSWLAGVVGTQWSFLSIQFVLQRRIINMMRLLPPFEPVGYSKPLVKQFFFCLSTFGTFAVSRDLIEWLESLSCEKEENDCNERSNKEYSITFVRADWARHIFPEWHFFITPRQSFWSGQDKGNGIRAR